MKKRRTKDENLRELNELKKEIAALKEKLNEKSDNFMRVESKLAHLGIGFNHGNDKAIRNKQEIKKLFDDFIRMYSTRDEKLIDLLSDNFTGITGGGDFLVKDKVEWIKITKKDFAQIKDDLKLEMNDVSIQFLSDTAAAVTSLFQIHLPMKDDIFSNKTARGVLIFNKEDNNWKISHCSVSVPDSLVQDGEIYPVEGLKEKNQKLEDIINERTVQLSVSNENLKKINDELAEKIAKQKNTEEALLETNRKLEAIISATPDGIGMISLDGKIQLIMSDKLPEMYGYSVEDKNEFVGRSAFDFIDPSNHNILKDNIRKLLSGEEDGKLTEYIAIKKDNSRFFIDVNSTVLHDSDGNPFSVLFVERDITARKKNEALIQRQYTQLNELNATKDKLFSIIAHDLRSPFQTLLSSSEILATQIDNLSHKEIVAFSSGLNNSLKNLYALLENLLNWSMMQRDMLDFNPVNIKLFEFIEILINVSEQSAEKKNISIINKVEKESSVLADSEMLRSVIQNLLTNAIKFTKAGGEIIISSNEKDILTEVSVQDSGIGIGKEKLNKLFTFETFYSTVGTAGEKGTGLGLSLCKEFVEKNGGKIQVESEVGKGSKFLFTLRKNNKF